MKGTMFLVCGSLALGANFSAAQRNPLEEIRRLSVLGEETPLKETRLRAENPLETALEKTPESFTYSDLMEVDSTKRRRTLHAISPDRQHALIATHLHRMLEMHRQKLSSRQKGFIEHTLDELDPRDFVRRSTMDQPSLMRAWRGDRLGRLYRETDPDALQELFPEALARQVFKLE